MDKPNKVWWVASLVLVVGCGSGPSRRDAAIEGTDANVPLDAPFAPIDAATGADGGSVPDARVIAPDAHTSDPDAFVVEADAFFTTDPDAGVDAGAIVLMDAGARADAGTDASMVPSMCGPWGGLTATNVSPVPASCLPRCSSDTLDAVNACPGGDGGTCLYDALADDTTAPIAMSFTGATGPDSLDVDCTFCFEIQRFHCFSQVCPAESSPYFVCDPATDADLCANEQTALQDCLDAIVPGSVWDTRLDECLNTQVAGCFDAGTGFSPGAHGVRVDLAVDVIRGSR